MILIAHLSTRNVVNPRGVVAAFAVIFSLCLYPPVCNTFDEEFKLTGSATRSRLDP